MTEVLEFPSSILFELSPLLSEKSEVLDPMKSDIFNLFQVTKPAVPPSD